MNVRVWEKISGLNRFSMGDMGFIPNGKVGSLMVNSTASYELDPPNLTPLIIGYTFKI